MLAICLCTGYAIAQSKQGEINGTVASAQGGIIPFAHVTLKGQDTRTTLTDDSGEYAFKNLRRGSYNARFEYRGFHPTDAKVSVGDKPVRLDAVLRVFDIQ